MFDCINDEMPAAGMGELAIMDHTGDMKTIWDPSNAEEVAMAQDQFNRLVVEKKTHEAFKVEGKGEAGARITEFDPREGKIILIPKLQGG